MGSMGASLSAKPGHVFHRWALLRQWSAPELMLIKLWLLLSFCMLPVAEHFRTRHSGMQVAGAALQ